MDADCIISERIKNVELGEVGFVHSHDTGSFKYGNIEAVTSTDFLISFEKATWDRRDDAVPFPFDKVLLGHELNVRKPGENYTYQAREIVLRKIDSNTVEPLCVLASQEEAEQPLLVSKIVLQKTQIWTPAGDAFAIATAAIYHPRLLSLMQQCRFRSPIHPLFDILSRVAGEKIDLQQSATFGLAKIDIPVRCHLEIDGHIATIKLGMNYFLSSALMGVARENVADETLSPVGESNPEWSARVAFTGISSSVDRGTPSASISVVPQVIEIVHYSEPVVATSEVYVGASVSAWSDVICYREPQINFLLLRLKHPPIPNSINLPCFGRNAILYVPHCHIGVSHQYLSVLRLGGPLQERERNVLSAFIGYVTGGRAANVMTETFSLERKLQTTIHDRGNATTRKQPPIPIENAAHYARFVTFTLGQVLDTFRRWRAVDERSFDAIFHHYAEGVDSSYPVTRTLRLTIAFEAFVNLVTLDKAENETIVSGKLFKGLRTELEQTIEAYSETHSDLPPEARKRLLNKLESFNTASNARRLKRFWELVPITRSVEDDKLLRRLRNESVHKGFLGENDGEQDVLGDAQDAARLCDLLNRAILHHAGYLGPVLSAENGRWMDAKTGATYRVPPIPQGPTIEITHKIDDVLTEAEKTALDRLGKVQRKTSLFEKFIVDDLIRFPER